MNINIKNGINTGSNKLIDHIQKNLLLYLLAFISICIGIIVGFCKVKYMGSSDRTYMIQWMRDSLNIYDARSVPKMDIFFTSMKNYLPMIVFIWFLGLTIIGTPLILIVDLFKGYTVGFTFSFIINNFGATGVWVGVGSVLLQNLIFLPCIIIMSVYAMEFSMGIIKEKSFSLILPSFISYSLKCIIIFLVMLLGFFIEAYITPYILNFLKSMLGVLIL